MTEYLVRWDIDKEAADPIAAARDARRTQLDPESWAVCFKVTDKATGIEVEVDLDEEDVAEVVTPTESDILTRIMVEADAWVKSTSVRELRQTLRNILDIAHSLPVGTGPV